MSENMKPETVGNAFNFLVRKNIFSGIKFKQKVKWMWQHMGRI